MMEHTEKDIGPICNFYSNKKRLTIILQFGKTLAIEEVRLGQLFSALWVIVLSFIDQVHVPYLLAS